MSRLLLNPYSVARPPLTSIAFETSATAAAQTIACPTVQAQDVAVLFDIAKNAAGVPSSVVPSGFTQVQTSAGSLTRATISYKLLDGSESGQSLSGMVGTTDTAKVLLIFRPNGSIATITTSTFLQETTDGNPASQLIAAAGQPTPLIQLGALGINSQNLPPSFSTSPFTATVGANGATIVSIRGGYRVQNSSPSDDSVDANDGGTGNVLMSGWMRFA